MKITLTQLYKLMSCRDVIDLMSTHNGKPVLIRILKSKNEIFHPDRLHYYRASHGTDTGTWFLLSPWEDDGWGGDIKREYHPQYNNTIGNAVLSCSAWCLGRDDGGLKNELRRILNGRTLEIADAEELTLYDLILK